VSWRSMASPSGIGGRPRGRLSRLTTCRPGGREERPRYTDCR
jgi:hypothetical protein